MNVGEAGACPEPVERVSRLSSDYREALAWLYGTQRFGIKLGLENMQRLLCELDVPGRGPRIVHVAGTNGKGSVCAMIDAVCRAQGYRTGLFTSPHLVTYRERIQVNGEMIAEENVAKGLMLIRKLINDWDPHPTFFEITTALALIHFKERACEVIVLETGLGGRLDATNAVEPVVSVITPIGYDHQAWLGNSLEEIAGEKAGIIKARVPVVSAPQEASRRESDPCATGRVRSAPFDSWTNPIRQPPRPGWSAPKKKCVAFDRRFAIRRDHRAEGEIARASARPLRPARFRALRARTIIDGAHNLRGRSFSIRDLARTIWR